MSRGRPLEPIRGTMPETGRSAIDPVLRGPGPETVRGRGTETGGNIGVGLGELGKGESLNKGEPEFDWFASGTWDDVPSPSGPIESPSKFFVIDERPLQEVVSDFSKHLDWRREVQRKFGRGRLETWRKDPERSPQSKAYTEWKKMRALDTKASVEDNKKKLDSKEPTGQDRRHIAEFWLDRHIERTRAFQDRLYTELKLDKASIEKLERKETVLRPIEEADRRLEGSRYTREFRADFGSVKNDLLRHLDDHRLGSEGIRKSQFGPKLAQVGRTPGDVAIKSLASIFSPGRGTNPHTNLAVLGPAPATQSSEDVIELILAACAKDGISVSAEDLVHARPDLDAVVQGAMTWCMASEQAFWSSYRPQIQVAVQETAGDLMRTALAFQISVIDEHQRMCAPVQYLNPTDPPWIWQLPDDRADLIRQLLETYMEKGHAAVYDLIALYRYRGEHVLPRFVACDALLDALTLLWESRVPQEPSAGTAVGTSLAVEPFKGEFPSFDALPAVSGTTVTFESLTTTVVEQDKQFLKPDKPTSDDETLPLLNAVMSAGSVLAFLGGPTGIVVASGVTLVQGMLPLAAGHRDTFLTLLDGFEKVAVKDLIEKQLNHVKSFASWVMDQKDILEGVDRDLAEFQRSGLKMLDDETGTVGDTLFNSAVNIENNISWDTPKARVAVLLSLTYLFVAYNLKCRIYASMALGAKEAGKSDDFHAHSASFRAQLKVMQRELSQRSARVKEVLEGLRRWRREQVSWIGSTISGATGDPTGQSANTMLCSISWTDKYTGFTKWEPYDPGSLICYLKRGKFSDMDDVVDRQKKAYDAYMIELEGHIDRAFQNDLKIVEKWAEISKDVTRLLVPAPPIFAPSVARYDLLPSPHPLLIGAKSVAYSYTVGTEEDGDSKPSPWTDWLPLQTVEGVLQAPVLTIRDSNYSSETRRTVYHRVMKDGQSVEDAALDSSVAEVFKAKGAVLWVDSQPTMPALS